MISSRRQLHDRALALALRQGSRARHGHRSPRAPALGPVTACIACVTALVTAHSASRPTTKVNPLHRYSQDEGPCTRARACVHTVLSCNAVTTIYLSLKSLIYGALQEPLHRRYKPLPARPGRRPGPVPVSVPVSVPPFDPYGIGIQGQTGTAVQTNRGSYMRVCARACDYRPCSCNAVPFTYLRLESLDYEAVQRPVRRRDSGGTRPMGPSARAHTGNSNRTTHLGYRGFYDSIRRLGT